MHQVNTVQFIAPFHAVVKTTANTHPSPLTASSVLVRTIFSAVSTGTELLAYRGEMPTDIAVDALFPSHTAATFSYPVAYGYAAVGRVSAVGSDVVSIRPGDHVFAFREHTSSFLADEKELHRIPDGTNLQDAVLLPNVETAVSLAMDVALLPGEIACIVGQGIVGLLLISVLKKLYPCNRIVAIDVNEKRRQISKECARADAALDPATNEFASALTRAFNGQPGADVSVDVSGAGAGLETAIRATRDHGKVVIGSWFGNKDVKLSCLGGRFHRSHIQLVASQVSHIPAALSGRWSKERRFQLSWDLLRAIRPSECFPMYRVDVNQAPKAYEELELGKHLQVIFKYEEYGDA